MIIIVVAMNNNRVIGNNNKLPWHCKEDLKHFKEITNGKHIVMGRKTFQSLPKMLPNRHHIVLTRDENFSHDGVEVFNSIDDLLVTYDGRVDLYVIGGADIYNQFMNKCDKIEMTVIDGNHSGDTYFPELPNPHEWQFVYNKKIRDICTFLTFTKRETYDSN